MVSLSKRMLKCQFAADDAVATDLKRLGPISTYHTISWGVGVASGTVEIEAAETVDDTAWASVSTVTFTGGLGPATDYVNVPGGATALRHRISTIVEGGTVSSKISGSE